MSDHVQDKSQLTLSRRKRAVLICALSLLGILQAVSGLVLPADPIRLGMMDAYLGRPLTQYAVTGDQLAGSIHRAKVAANVPLFAALSGAQRYVLGHGAVVGALESPNEGRYSAVQIEAALCSALSEFLLAVRREPAVVRYHLAVADAASRLAVAGRPCRFEGGDAGKLRALSFLHLDFARKLAPHDTTMLYLSALIYFRLGEKQQGLEQLRLSQEINPLFSEEQRQYFFRLVNTEQELEHALSGGLADVIAWSEHFRRFEPERFEKWEHVFVKAVIGALDGLPDSAELRGSRQRLQERELMSLARSLLVLRNDALRRKLDALLARHYAHHGNKKWSTVLEERRRLARIPIVKAFLPSDPLPETSMLYSWRTDLQLEPVRLARTGFVLGAYIPRGFEIKMLVIENERMRWRPNSDELELRVSEDNQSFALLRQQYAFQTFNVGGREKVVLRFPGLKNRYLKIQYRGAAASGVLKNQQAFMLQAYGQHSGGELK